MKLVILSDVYLPFLSGVSTVVHHLSKEYPRFGIDVTLVVPSPRFHLDTLFRRDRKYNRNIFLVPSSRLFKIYDELRFPLRMFVPLNGLDDECILQIHSPMVLGTAGVKKIRRLRDKKKIKCALVGIFHTRVSEYFSKRMNENIANKLARLTDFYTKHIYRRMDVTILLSNYVRSIVERIGIDNTFYLPNPLNRAYFIPPKKNVDYFFEGLEPYSYFLYLGRISHEKKVDLLAKIICSKKRDYKFVFAGSEPLLEYLKNKFGNGNCIFLGRVSFKAQKALYRDAVAFVSASDWEVQPMTFLEAMAQGTPSVASVIGGQRDYLVDGFNSLLFRDPLEIPSLLDRLWSNMELRETLGYNARKTAERYHPENLIPRHKRFFEILLTKI